VFLCSRNRFILLICCAFRCFICIFHSIFFHPQPLLLYFCALIILFGKYNLKIL
jgi:hypothetical protein